MRIMKFCHEDAVYASSPAAALPPPPRRDPFRRPFGLLRLPLDFLPARGVLAFCAPGSSAPGSDVADAARWWGGRGYSAGQPGRMARTPLSQQPSAAVSQTLAVAAVRERRGVAKASHHGLCSGDEAQKRAPGG